MTDGEVLTRSDYKKELEANNAIAFVPSGNSMWPILKNKGQSVVVYKKTERLKRYDVALYERANGVFVLHRVIEPILGGYVICGDSQFTLEKVKEEQVFGVMAGFYHGTKYIRCTDERYKKKVEKWYKHAKRRKLRLRFFYFRVRVKGFIGRVFRKTTKKNEQGEKS